MNLHEYQAKNLLKKYGARIQEGVMIESTSDAITAAQKLTDETGTSWYVVKAQVHAGGRGK
ncbi:MAG TPA: succinate--CoA ligase subunit beta, partial [Bacteroidetes bacterium]|nr:succinate--CoA ligase subunit beta [Bacteroidota bacterium]